MNHDSYVYAIVALLPLSACMVVCQVNPYQALVIRGILGAVAALVYAVLGAADVALTEALVGTMLAIMLYAVAVRSSLILRLGVLQNESSEGKSDLGQLLDDFRRILSKRYMRLELVPYPDTQALHQALLDKEVHITCIQPAQTPGQEMPSYHAVTRIQRIYEIFQTELTAPATILTYVTPPDSGDQH